LAKNNSGTAARTLELLLVFSAGLSRFWNRTRILESYPSVLRFQKVFQQIDHQLLRSQEPIVISNFERLASTIYRFKPCDLVIATAHHGHFIAFINSCSRQGIPLSVCYRAASQSYLDAAAKNQLRLVNLGAQNSVLSLFDILDSERARGYYVVIMMDGAFQSRRYFDFLRYQVKGSSLASLYAQKTCSALLPLISHASDNLQIGFSDASVIEMADNTTAQKLLNFLQATILHQPFQYRWLSSSILMSDEIARTNAVGFLFDVLRWRDRFQLEPLALRESDG
jgi:hypothetical protein